jgi:WD40 repeat protein
VLETVIIKELEGHTETVEFTKFDCSGRWLVTGGMNNVLRVWDGEKDWALHKELD